MKITKIIGAWVLAVAMTISNATVLAAQTADEEAEKWDAALETVKERIEIPEGYIENSKDTHRCIYEVEGLFFHWKNENASIDVTSDTEGRILLYEHYSDFDNSIAIEENAENVTVEMLKEYVEENFPKILPEAFTDENDRFEYCDYDLYFSGDEKNYTLFYTRFRDGEYVEGNYFTVYFRLIKGKLWIWRYDSSFDYDAEFEAEAEEITDIEAAYKAAFPIELAYVDNKTESKIAGEKERDEIRLVYKKKYDNEYMSAYTGEPYDYLYDEERIWQNRRISYLANNSGKILTDTDIAEIDVNGVFKSIAECEELVRSFTELSIGNETLNKEKSHIIYSYDDDKYIWKLYFGDNEAEYYWSGIDVQLDAITGELLYFRNKELYYDTIKKDVSEEQRSRRDERVDAFLQHTASRIIGEFEYDEAYENASPHQLCYKRMKNGIPYEGDAIVVGYDFDSDKIFYYEADYNENASFAEPDGIIDIKAAQDYIFKAESKNREYVNFGDGYKLVYYMNNTDALDAFTGKTLDRDGEYEPTEVEYTDIDNHWCMEAVEYLRDKGIAFQGSKLYPDAAIKKEDMMRIFAAAVIDTSLMTADMRAVYSRYYEMDSSFTEIVEEEQPIRREQAFIYMIHFMGLNSLAKQTDASGMRFTDTGDFDANYKGYGALLAEMGIINGDGSTIRPKDSLTRAEALTMVYNFMKG